MIVPYTQQPARKSLGQNFLKDRNIARKIVALLATAPEDRVLEIGPGAGALTEFLLDTEARCVAALEKDMFWAHALKQARPELAVVLGDGLRFPWGTISHGKNWKIIGNLPYNVASPLMWEMFSRAEGFARAVFMVQKEVGLRLTAQPGGKIYGALSIWVQSFTRPRIAFTVGPGVFHPKPKVDSAVLVFEPISVGERRFNSEALAWLLHRCFQKRRKQLGTILGHKCSGVLESFFPSQGLDPRVRPEELTPQQFHILSNLLEKNYLY